MAHADHGHESENGEHTATDRGTSTRKLGAVAGINFVGFVVELAGGLMFGSVALISDAVHMLFDMLAYVMAFSASYTAERFEGGGRWSYGLHRLEPVAAFLNGILLVPMVGYIVWEAYQRFLDPVSINAELTLVIAVGGLLVNVGSVVVLQGGEMSLNERGAFYHLLGDAGGSIAVIVSTVAVAVFDLPVADPIAAVFIGILVLWSSWNVLHESSGILLQRSPVDPGDIREEIATIDGVVEVDDLHAWQVCSQLSVATVRVAIDTVDSERRADIQQRAHELFAEHGIDHATVELFESGADHAHDERHTH